MRLRLIHFFLALLWLGASAVGNANAQGEPRVALIIGNANYPDAESPLKDTLNYARSMADELKRSGFEVDLGENLTKEAMRTAIDRFYGKIKQGSAALFFFSGFGIQSDRQTYVIPVNAQIWTEADVRRDGFSLDSILAEMNSRGAKVKIAILDASRRNPFERRFRAVAAGLAPAATPRGTAIMYAAAPGTVLRETDRQYFVPELLKEIGRPGKIEEVFNRTLVAVSRESRGEQSPWFSSSLVDEFALVAPGGRPSGGQTSTPDPDADARRDYQDAERQGTKIAFEDFVRKYPSSRYTQQARDQIAKIDAEAAERRDYQDAERRGTKVAFEDFLRKHPSSRYAQQARDQIARLDTGRPQPDPEADARREYQNAERQGSKAAYEDFLRRYPSGRYADMARDQIAKIDAASRPDPDAAARRDYQDAERQGTKVAFEDFLRKHPSGRYADMARDQIAKLAPAAGKDDDKGADDPAIQDLNRRIESNRNDTAAYYKRGQLYAQHGNFRRAITDFDEVLRLNPKDAEALNNRCWARAIVGELQEALRDCNEALQIRPRYLDAFDSRGFVNLKIGLPRNALADYDAALRINPKHASALYGRGIAKLRTGNTASGNGDVAAAKAIQSDIAEEFANYGIR